MEANLNIIDSIKDFYFLLECEVDGEYYQLEGTFSTSDYTTAVQKLEEGFVDSEIGELGRIISITIEEVPIEQFS